MDHKKSDTFQICTNVGDAIKISDQLIKHAKERNFDLYSRSALDEISHALYHLNQSMQFYANKNYDNGLIARMTLGQMTRDDEQKYAIHANNTYNLNNERLDD